MNHSTRFEGKGPSGGSLDLCFGPRGDAGEVSRKRQPGNRFLLVTQRD